jgi:large subunit ribosomal protein L29
MKRKELMDLNKGEHEAKLIEFRKELIKLNAQAATGTAMKNPGLVKQTKKNIARLLTIMNKDKKVTNKA